MARWPILSDGTDATPERVAEILGAVRPYPTECHPTVAAQLVESVTRNYSHERPYLRASVGAEAGARVIAADLVNRHIASGPAELAVVLTAAREMLAS